VPPELRGPLSARGPSGLIGRVIATILAAGALVLGLMFSMVIFAVALVVGAGLFGWLWWKMRRVMKQARQDPHLRAYREAADEATRASSQIIEGEVIRGEWKKDSDQR
jgi:Flp pilus assembly protein TadB